jgi:ribosomal protein S18 acetylase RimI-like enzyme
MSVDAYGLRAGKKRETTKIEYRSAADDVDLLQLAHLFESVGWSRRARDSERLAQKVRNSMYAACAVEGDKLVGLAQAISDGAFHAYVGSVAVLPEYPRRGIGSELVRRLLDGRPHVTFVLHADPPVHPLYLRCGFRPAVDMLATRS